MTSDAFIPARAIGQKRDGHELAPDALRALLDGFMSGTVSDAQMAAFLMAVSFRGLESSELNVLVDSMIGSGAVMQRRGNERPRVDKHSTGGVGDKVSLVLAPLAAELGLEVPMMSGRGLGHTGGTLDKLESIPGFSTRPTLERFAEVLSTHGVAMIGQTDEIAPLDRRMYALRSDTGTVPAVPLIAASIMSKKLAEDLDGLVLDVKVGAGSFLVDMERTRSLASTMVGIGNARGVPTVALITRMDWPLGNTIGNALEVAEAIRCLRGEGPADLSELTAQLVGEMLVLGGLASDPEAGAQRAAALLAAGGALDRFARMVEAQGGDPRVIAQPTVLPASPERIEVTAKEAGIVSGIDPVALGWSVIELGGGRRRLDDSVDPTVGFELTVTVGETVDRDQPLGWVHANSQAEGERGAQVLLRAVSVAEPSGFSPDALPPLVYDRVTA